jgi:hypothetical protein
LFRFGDHSSFPVPRFNRCLIRAGSDLDFAPHPALIEFRTPVSSAFRVSMSHLLLRKWRGEVLEKDSVPNQIRKATGTSTNRLLLSVTICLLYRDTDLFSLAYGPMARDS